MELLGRTFPARALALAFTVMVLSVPAQAGRIVANNDEWATSNTGYTLAGAPSANNFVFNLATFLAGSGGNILVYSDLFALNQSSFKASLSAGGFNVTYGKASANLSGYNAVFLAERLPGSAIDLAAFVNGGGGVYIAAGTGYPGAAAEAARWNPFLTSFGLQLDSVYNNFQGNVTAGNSGHALLKGVTELYYLNGNTVSATGGNSNASTIGSSSNGPGLFGIYNSTGVSMPEPSTYFLVGAGLFAAYLKRRSASRA